MKEKDNTRIWLSVIIGLLVTLIVYWLTPSLVFKPKGLILPSQINRPATSVNQVAFYKDFPTQYQSLGIIHIARHYPAANSEQAEKEILTFARQLAAKAGANGVVIKFFAHSIPGMGPAGLAIYSFTGTPIYTSGNNQSVFPSFPGQLNQ